MAGILMADKINLLIKYKRRIYPCQAPSKNRTFVNTMNNLILQFVL